LTELEVSEAVLSKAQARASKIGENSKKICSDGELAGMVAEELFLDTYGGELVDSYNYDVAHAKIGCIDIKAKRCSSRPLDSYSCTVAAYQVKKKECSHYAFYRITNDLSTAYCLGIIPVVAFMEKAQFLKKDEIEEGTHFKVKCDCFNIKISDLDQIEEYL